MTEKYTEADFDEVDREALNRAMQMSLGGKDRGHARQVREKLSEDGWWEATSTAVYHHQIESLGLKPWQSPPCCDDGEESSRLLKRMLSHGVSQWEPVPLAAISASGKRR